MRWFLGGGGSDRPEFFSKEKQRHGEEAVAVGGSDRARTSSQKRACGEEAVAVGSSEWAEVLLASAGIERRRWRSAVRTGPKSFSRAHVRRGGGGGRRFGVGRSPS